MTSQIEAKATEQRIKVLQFQNQKLGSQLSFQREEISELQEKLQTAETREKEHAQRLLCINRIWDHLNADIQFLCSRAYEEQSEAADLAANQSDDLPQVSDPFLRRLVLSDLNAAKAVQGQLSDALGETSAAEQVLEARASNTKEHLAKIFQLIQRSVVKVEAETADASGSAGLASVVGEEHKSDNQRIITEPSTAAPLAAKRLASEEHIRLLKDRLFTAEQEIKVLRNELADKEEDLSVCKKKFHSLRESFPHNGPASQSLPSTQAQADASKPSTSTGDTKRDDELLQELHDMQKLLDRRTDDLAREKEAHSRTQRDLQDHKEKLSQESWVQNTQTYLRIKNENQNLATALGQKQRELEQANRDREKAAQDASLKQHVSGENLMLKTKLQAAATAMEELKVEVEELRRIKRDLEVAIQREKEKLGNTKTVQELKTTIGTLQKELQLLQQHGMRGKAAAEEMDAAKRDAADSAVRVQAKELEAQRLSEKLQAKDQELEGVKADVARVKERAADLKAFVDVLTSFCADPRDVVEVRASEALLKEQLGKLKAQVEGHVLHARIRELQASESSLHERHDAVQGEADGLRAQLAGAKQHVEELGRQLISVRAECNTYIAELEVAANACDEMRGQNVRLLQQLTERDETCHQLVAERMKLNQQQQGVAADLEAARVEAQRKSAEVNSAKADKNSLEKEVARITSELAQVREMARSSTAQCEALQAKLREREAAAVAFTAKLEDEQRSAEARRAQLVDMEEKLQREKMRRLKLEDENKILSNRLERVQKSSAAAPSDLEEEVEALRKLLNCSVCHERQKSVIITKCWHMFCHQCIKRNIDIRHRKCPGCGHPFGQQDVKSFFFT